MLDIFKISDEHTQLNSVSLNTNWFFAGIGSLAHGVTVAGPPTVPATITGPSGTVHAAGLWGPTLAHGHGGHW